METMDVLKRQYGLKVWCVKYQWVLFCVGGFSLTVGVSHMTVGVSPVNEC